MKRDARFKYVSIFKNHGSSAGQEFEHPTAQLTATTFVPRRVLYELRASREYFIAKERCVFCDILAQEERQNLRTPKLLAQIQRLAQEHAGEHKNAEQEQQGGDVAPVAEQAPEAAVTGSGVLT